MKRFVLILIFILIPFLAFAQENGGPYSPDSNTVLLMHFENNTENSATVGHDGSVHGNVSYESSYSGMGTCLRIHNASSSDRSWIQVPFYNELNFSDEFSIECWFKINSWGDSQTQYPKLLCKSNSGNFDYTFSIKPNAKVIEANIDCIDESQYARNAITRTNDILETSKWYHLAVYFDYSQHYLYLVLRDEQYRELASSRGYSFTRPVNSNADLMIGFGSYSDTYFDGYIDELRISNSARKYRDDIVGMINETALKDSVPPLLKDKWKVYQPPFDSYFPVSSSTGERMAGADCGETAMLRIVHYWEYPRFPEGYLDFELDNYHWTVDYNNTEYLYDQMPYVFAANPTENDYRAAATLARDIAAPKNYYLIGYNGRNVYMPDIFKRYFLFGKDTRFVFREEYNKDEWIKIFKNELSNGRPILLCGNEERFENGSVAGHFYICDGYKGDLFHTDLSIGSTEYWVDIDDFPYGMNQEALIFAEPDRQGRSLTLDYPAGGEYFLKGTPINISWHSEQVSTVVIEYSSDGGETWIQIADNIPASNASYRWTLPETSSDKFRIRVSNKDNLNIYMRSENFNVFDTISLSFKYPINGNHFQADALVPIYWSSEGIRSVKLEYSTDQTNWIVLKDSVNSASGYTFCYMPDINSSHVRLKATDVDNESNTYISEEFSVSADALLGGSYKLENNAVVLMHFDNDLSNLTGQTQATYSSGENYFDNYDLGLGKAFLIENSPTSANNCLTLPNCDGFDLGNHWSINFWLKVRSYGSGKTEYPSILDKPDILNIGLRGNGVIRANLKFKDGQQLYLRQNSQLDMNAWYHVELESDIDNQSITLKIHDDQRTLVFEQCLSFPSGSNGLLQSSNEPIKIGGVAMGSNIQFDGWIDELRITKGKATQSDLLKIPTNISLNSYPNPFNASCTIEYELPNDSYIDLDIIDLQGHIVRHLIDQYQVSGHYKLRREFSELASGLYFYRLKTMDTQIIHKMLILK